MLIQEHYDRLGILLYGNDCEQKGVRRQLENDTRRMYAKGISPQDIAERQEVPLKEIEIILGLQLA